jgi:hypothetical protein
MRFAIPPNYLDIFLRLVETDQRVQVNLRNQAPTTDHALCRTVLTVCASIRLQNLKQIKARILQTLNFIVPAHSYRNQYDFIWIHCNHGKLGIMVHWI